MLIKYKTTLSKRIKTVRLVLQCRWNESCLFYCPIRTKKSITHQWLLHLSVKKLEESRMSHSNYCTMVVLTNLQMRVSKVKSLRLRRFGILIWYFWIPIWFPSYLFKMTNLFITKTYNLKNEISTQTTSFNKNLIFTCSQTLFKKPCNLKW